MGGAGRGRAGPDRGEPGAQCPPTPLCPPQVTELHDLSSLAVGAVTCDITDFFTTQVIVVVILGAGGTIKLQLEVLWK